MINERIMILEMVKEGKISVDDAVKLLNAINKNNTSCFDGFDDFANDLKYKFDNIPKLNANKIKENAQSFFNKTEETFNEITTSLLDFFTSTNSENSRKNNETINVEPVEPENKDEKNL